MAGTAAMSGTANTQIPSAAVPPLMGGHPICIEGLAFKGRHTQIEGHLNYQGRLPIQGAGSGKRRPPYLKGQGLLQMGYLCFNGPLHCEYAPTWCSTHLHWAGVPMPRSANR